VRDVVNPIMWGNIALAMGLGKWARVIGLIDGHGLLGRAKQVRVGEVGHVYCTGKLRLPKQTLDGLAVLEAVKGVTHECYPVGRQSAGVGPL
jgi:hypothetical protein